MQTPDSLQQIYDDLANRFAQEDEAANRDHCLLLAADAALRAGLPNEAERLRKRLLAANPHHLLWPFSSLSEAMESKDVRDYVEDLRQRWSPENIEKLLSQSWMGKEPAPGNAEIDTYRTEERKTADGLPAANKPAKEKKAVSAPAPRRKDPVQRTSLPPATSGGYVMALLLFVAALLAACGMLYLVFGMALVE